MSSDKNFVSLHGHVTKNAEMKYTHSGTALCTFSIACNESRKLDDGTWENTASFFDCAVWGKLAEAVSERLVKGRRIAIDGKLKQQTWEDNSGKRSKVSIQVQSIEMLESLSERREGTASQSLPKKGVTYRQKPANGPESFISDDLF